MGLCGSVRQLVCVCVWFSFLGGDGVCEREREREREGGREGGRRRESD